MARIAVCLALALACIAGPVAASEKSTAAEKSAASEKSSAQGSGHEALLDALARLQQVIAEEEARYREAKAGRSHESAPAKEHAAGDDAGGRSADAHTPPAKDSHKTPAATAAEHPAKPSAVAGKAARTADPDSLWEDLLKGNVRFVAGEPRERTLIATRQQLAYGQHPGVIVLTCSDSRVCPELIFDKSLGDIFVVRTAGNVADPVALGSIEYAAEHLHATLLLILGHEKCGAVAAAASGQAMPTPNLEAIVDRIRPAVEKAKARAAGDDLAHVAMELNVHQSTQNLLEESPILQDLVHGGKLRIVKAVYDLGSGQVTTLPEVAPS